jgi:hypothetical protein
MPMMLVKATMKLLGFAHPQAWATWVVSWPLLIRGGAGRALSPPSQSPGNWDAYSRYGGYA